MTLTFRFPLTRWLSGLCFVACTLLFDPSVGFAVQTPEEIFAQRSPGVLLVQGVGPFSLPQSSGTGFIVGSTGVFVTNFHVIEHAQEVTVKLKDGREFKVSGSVELNRDLDLAVLKIDAQNLVTVPLGNSDAMRVGQRVLAIGNPMGLEQTISDGLISAIRGDTPDEKLFQITAPISPGSSGGPLFNLNGEVIGITVAQLTEGQNLNFAIPINAAKPFIKEGPIQAFSSQSSLPTVQDCPVVGNLKSGIYHVPGGQYYAGMIFSPDAVCFKSEEEAKKSGFRQSQR
jgi:S1-C subfamily serine protease